jgi:hypothetical protein
MRTFDANRYFIVISDDDSDQESEISPAHKRPRRIEKAGNMLDANLKTMRIAVRQTQLAFIKIIPARRTAYDHATAAIDLEPRDKIVGTDDIEILESLGGTLDREWREGTAPAFHGERYIVSTLPNDESLHVTTNLRPQRFLTAVPRITGTSGTMSLTFDGHTTFLQIKTTEISVPRLIETSLGSNLKSNDRVYQAGLNNIKRFGGTRKIGNALFMTLDKASEWAHSTHCSAFVQHCSDLVDETSQIRQDQASEVVCKCGRQLSFTGHDFEVDLGWTHAMSHSPPDDDEIYYHEGRLFWGMEEWNEARMS